MAIGTGWEDGSWVDAGWIAEAWDDVANVVAVVKKRAGAAIYILFHRHGRR